MSKSQSEFPSWRKLCRALHSGEYTFFFTLYFSWHLYVLMCRAPADCFQYHTGVFGNVQSMNFEKGQILSSQVRSEDQWEHGIGSRDHSARLWLAGLQAYRICFRQELEYCAITFTASLDTRYLQYLQYLQYISSIFTISILSTSPDPFEMLTNSPGTITTAGNCKTTYVGIPQVDRI